MMTIRRLAIGILKLTCWQAYFVGFIICLATVTSGIAGQPSFDCRAASKPDEFAICNDESLSDLDNIANEGYLYLKSTMGRRAANAIDLPIIRSRQNCGSNKQCIRQVQIEAINLFRSYGAPLRQPESAPEAENSTNSRVESERLARQRAEQEALAAQVAREEAQRELQQAEEAKNRAEAEAKASREQAALIEEQRNKALKESVDKDRLLSEKSARLKNQEAEQAELRKNKQDFDEKLFALAIIVGGIVGLFIYFIPSLIAFKRGHDQKWVILFLNFFGGFTIIIWLAVLIWSLQSQNKVDERSFLKKAEGDMDGLERLYTLKQAGAISSEEFEKSKASFLKPKVQSFSRIEPEAFAKEAPVVEVKASVIEPSLEIENQKPRSSLSDTNRKKCKRCNASVIKSMMVCPKCDSEDFE